MKWIKWLLLLGIGFLLAYEVYGLMHVEPGDTISEHVWAWSERSDIVPFGFGFLMGHFFFQRKRK
jgi:hypothetical protein